MISISTNSGLSCAVKKSGEVYCWGDNRHGSAGVPLPPDADPVFTKMYITKPNQVKNIKNAKSLSLGSLIGCAYLDDGKIKCWGTGFNHLGNGWGIHTDPYEFKAP